MMHFDIFAIYIDTAACVHSQLYLQLPIASIIVKTGGVCVATVP